MKEQIIAVDYIGQSNELNYDFLGKDKGRHIYIKSRTGTGKTTWMKKILKGLRVLVISHRRSLVRQACQAYDIYNYENFRTDIKDEANLAALTANGIGVCVNSLVNLVDGNDTHQFFNDFDLVVIDEIVPLFNSVIGENMTIDGLNSQRAIVKMSKLITERSFVSMDADLSDNFIKHFNLIIKNNDITTVINKKIHESNNKRDVTFYDNEAQFLKVLKDTCEDTLFTDEKIFVFSDSAKWCEEMATDFYALGATAFTAEDRNNSRSHSWEEQNKELDRLQDIGRYVIDSETGRELLDEKGEMVEVEGWTPPQYNIIFGSPTIETGIDIRQGFDKVFLYVKQDFGAYEWCQQFMSRVRAWGERHIFLENVRDELLGSKPVYQVDAPLRSHGIRYTWKDILERDGLKADVLETLATDNEVLTSMDRLSLINILAMRWQLIHRKEKLIEHQRLAEYNVIIDHNDGGKKGKRNPRGSGWIEHEFKEHGDGLEMNFTRVGGKFKKQDWSDLMEVKYYTQSQDGDFWEAFRTSYYDIKKKLDRISTTDFELKIPLNEVVLFSDQIAEKLIALQLYAPLISTDKGETFKRLMEFRSESVEGLHFIKDRTQVSEIEDAVSALTLIVDENLNQRGLIYPNKRFKVASSDLKDSPSWEFIKRGTGKNKMDFLGEFMGTRSHFTTTMHEGKRQSVLAWDMNFTEKVRYYLDQINMV